MYQAIVFLPLLGAILAGLIAIAGARARCPGEGPPPGLDEGAAASDHGTHAAPAHAAQSHDAHDAHGHESAAAGSRTAELITTTLLMISMILSWIAFVQVGFGHHDERVPVFTWFLSGDLKVDWSLRIDTLTAVMLVVVNMISGFVHLYSIGYMEEDPYRPRFFAYLSIFTFFMLMLVTADNLVQMYFGWEGVGLASYLLIGFWYHKPEANAAAIKAFVVNRVGDFGFALGIFALFALVGAIDFDIELILLAVNINLVAFSSYLGDIVGQIYALLVLTVAAAEAAIGLAILVVYYRNSGSIAVEDINLMKG